MPEFSQTEVAAFIDALGDDSASVRLAALRALVRLGLTRDVWMKVSEHVKGLLESKLEGHDFRSFKIGGLPLAEVVESAVFIPTNTVRSILRSMLAASEPQLRSHVAHTLASSRDPIAIPQLIADLAEGPKRPRLDAAKSLSFVISPNTPSLVLREVRAQFKSETDPDVRFWLSVALAAAGETTAIVSTLKLMQKRSLVLHELFGDPRVFLNQLQRRGPFTARVQKSLLPFTSPTEDLISNIAETLRQAQQPQPESPPVEVSLPPPDESMQQQASAVREQLETAGDLNHELVEKISPNVVGYLPAEYMGSTVTALFKDAIGYGETEWPGNEIVRCVYEAGSKFTPDLKGLFHCYVIASTESEEAAGDAQAYRHEAPGRRYVPSALRWQLAWTASRADMTEVLETLSQPLSWADEKDKLGAAQLVEDIVLYAKQDYPPMFGGGSGPEDLIPNVVEFIDDVETLENAAKSRERATGSKSLKGAGDAPKTAGDEGGGDMPDATDELPLNRGNGGKAERVQKVINTGFATRENPDSKIQNTRPLIAGEKYFFWLDRSEIDKTTSGEKTPVDLQHEVPEGAVLTVAIFGFIDGIQVEAGSDVAEMEVIAGREFRVVKKPSEQMPENSKHLEDRLFFPVTMPPRPGEARMRCNIYWKQTLLQSRLLKVQVVNEANAPEREDAFISLLDYNLTRELDPEHVRQMPEHRLSLMLNDNANGTHSFHIFGANGEEKFKQDDVRFTEGELQALVSAARGTLRVASWDSPNELNKEEYKYKDGARNLTRLQNDLINMARWGYEFYAHIRRRFAGDVKGGNLAERQKLIKDFEELMREPGVLQIAMKESPSYVLPAAMIYDYPFSSNKKSFSLCPTFKEAFQQNKPLQDLPCFIGNCPSRGKKTTVCPSGFWGFRHCLGMPLSMEKGPAAATEIKVTGEINIAVGVATSLQFVTPHTRAVKDLRPAGGWTMADNSDDLFENLKQSLHVVYFYCHGLTIRDALPGLELGQDEMIFSSTFISNDIIWETRPLVFINGCHTAAVEPHVALQFVSPLITECYGAGVIGTEITIFEELATRFAEECLRRFYANESIGEAIRNARLQLLADGNPLGLVYIPFVMSGLKMNFVN